MVLIDLIPSSMGHHLPALVGMFSVPLGIVSDPDSFYYAMLPMLAEAGAAYGVPAIAFARAAILGHTTVGWTITPLIGTTFLMVGLAEVELGDYQKHSALILWGLSSEVQKVVTGIILILAVFVSQERSKNMVVK